MKTISSVLTIALIFFNISAASAQVMDMRAFSKQRGFKAYSAHVSQPVRHAAAQQTGQTASAANQKKKTDKAVNEAAAAGEVSEKEADQTDEMKQYIENNPQVRPDI